LGILEAIGLKKKKVKLVETPGSPFGRSRTWSLDAYMETMGFEIATATRDISESKRIEINQRAYTMYQSNPLIFGCINGLIAMQVGSGMMITHTNPKVNAILQEWIVRDKVYEKLQKMMRRWYINGEVFSFNFIDQLEGDMTTVEFDPYFVKDVRYNADDFSEDIGFYREYQPVVWDGSSHHNQSKGDMIQEYCFHNQEIGNFTTRDYMFWRIPMFSNTLRGVSTFAAAMPMIYNLKYVINTQIETARARLSRLGIMKVPGGQANVDRAAADLQEKGAPTPGEVLVIGKESEFNYEAVSLGMGDFNQFINLIMRCIASAFNVPNSFFSANVAESSYSSNTTKYNEFERIIAANQDLWRANLKEWAMKALMAKIRAKKLKKTDLQGEIMINFPNFPRSYNEKQGILTMALQMGLISRQTAAENLPFFVDYEAEMKKIQGEMTTNPILVEQQKVAKEKAKPDGAAEPQPSKSKDGQHASGEHE